MDKSSGKNLFSSRNKNINRGYRKLEIWNESVDLYKFVKEKLNSVTVISFKTKAQIEDSALSVSSNIAEGYSRRSLKESIRFYDIALASLSENYSQFYCLLSTNEVEDEWFKVYDDKHYSVENKLIKMNKVLLEKLANDDWDSNYKL
jgi:four helix bundle protein